MEYSEDLRYYYKSCHGSESNLKLACFTVVDLIKHLETNDTYPKVIAYFSHSTLVHLFMAALAAETNQHHLLAANYLDMKDRNYRSSRTAPFATNVAVIKYNCNETLSGGQISTKIMFLLNGKPLDIDWCTDGLCDWLKVLRKLKQFSDCENTFCQKV